MLKPGDTFIAPLTSKAIEHLWIILTNADAEGKAVAVNITTRHSLSETTVILNAGDHPFVKHPSVINYTDAQLIDLKAVETAIEKQPRNFVCKSHQPCSPDLLKRIQDGMRKTKSVKKHIKQRCLSDWEAKEKSANPEKT
jgi:hypothetical protein